MPTGPGWRGLPREGGSLKGGSLMRNDIEHNGLIDYFLTAVNAPRGFLALSNPHGHAVGATCRPDNVTGLNPAAHQEEIMNQLVRAGAITVAIFGSVSFAAAQNSPNQMPGPAYPDLTARQQQMVSQGLASSPSQAAPDGSQPQVGNKLPASMTAQSLPSNVTDQVPDAKNLLFVKLPDRVLLIDPDSKMVTEIFGADETTTGSNTNSSNPSSSDSSNRPSK